jgi:YbbR domain-containing protein
VEVTITLRQITATRTFSAGVQLVGLRPDLTYALTTDRILATIGGSSADLDRLQGRFFAVTADATGLEVGEHDVLVTANLPAGLTLVVASPATIRVIVTSPAPDSPSPSPTLSP